MPAVQTAFGPIVEPGWPDLKGPDMGAKFLSGAYIMGNINAKRQQLENQMAQYALKMQGMEQDASLREKKYQLDVDRLQQQGDYKDQAIDLQRRGADARDARVQLAFDKFDQRAAGDKAMFDAATNVLATIPKDDERFPNAFVQAVTNNARDADPAKARMLIQTNVNDYNINANRQNTALEHQDKMLKEKIGSKLYGDPALHFTDPIEHPEKYPEEMTGGSSWWQRLISGPTLSGDQSEKPTPTGNRTGTITLPSGETKEVTFKTKDLTELTKQWKAHQALIDKRLPTVNIPEFGVYAKPANSDGEIADRILADPNSSELARQKAMEYKRTHP